LEEEFRADLEEKQHIIAAFNTKVGFRAQQICTPGSPGLKVYSSTCGGGVYGRAEEDQNSVGIPGPTDILKHRRRAEGGAKGKVGS
jgi:hypothetical protein